MNLRDALRRELEQQRHFSSLELAQEWHTRRRWDDELPDADQTAIDRELNAMRAEQGCCDYRDGEWWYVPGQPAMKQERTLFG